MKKIFISLVAVSLFVFSMIMNAIEKDFINMDIEGISCPFCINSLITDLGKLPEVEEVRVSVDHKKLLIIIKSGSKANSDKINETVKNAGFVALKTDVTTTSKKPPVKTKQPLVGNVHVDIKSQSCRNCHSQ